MGRLTLNPKSHIDPFMSIILPLLLLMFGSPVIFGAAKPVPVDPFNLRDGRRDMALVSLAGPAANILIAIIASVLFKVFTQTGISEILFLTAHVNLLLAIFNLLPIPPLDGSKIFALLLPEKEANTYLSIGTVGMFILFFLLVFPIGGFSLNELIFNLLTFAEKLMGII